MGWNTKIQNIKIQLKDYTTTTVEMEKKKKNCSWIDWLIDYNKCLKLIW